MAKQLKHGTEKRESRDAKVAGRLAEWLNESGDVKAKNRVLSLLRDIHTICDTPLEEVVEDGELVDRFIPKSEKEYRAAGLRIFQTFKKYKFYPMVWAWGDSLVCQWAPLSGPAGKFKKHWPPLFEEGYTENEAIYEITWLMPKAIAGLRQCSCGKWFFKKFSHQRFCSVKCREREFRSTDEWKAYRREKAREYYWLQKNKNVK
jgi:hypothetical protein